MPPIEHKRLPGLSGGVRPAHSTHTTCDCCGCALTIENRDAYTIRSRDDGDVDCYCLRCWEEIRTPYDTMRGEKLPAGVHERLKAEYAKTIAKGLYADALWAWLGATLIIAGAVGCVWACIEVARGMGWL